MRGVTLVLFYNVGRVLAGPVREAVHGDRTGEKEFDRFLELFRFVIRQHQQLHGPFHVDAVGFLGGHLRFRGEGSCQMEDHIEVVIVKDLDPVDQIPLDMLC